MKDPTGAKLGYCVQVATAVLVVLLLMFLFGCATVATPPPVVTSVKTQIVHVREPVPCNVNVPKRPDSAVPPPTADDAALTAGIIADAHELRDPGRYLDQLEAALKACAGGNTP